MLSLRQPDSRQVALFIERQAKLEFNYPDVGATAGPPPAGYEFNRVRIELGEGDDVFRRACDALRRWRQFLVGWVEAVPSDAPLAVGNTVAVRARVLGIWALAACRIVEVFDESDERRSQFGFAYGTLPDHPEQGEERFLVEKTADGRVCYEVSAFFRPNSLLMRLGWPCFRRLFNRFRRQSAEAMLRRVSQVE